MVCRAASISYRHRANRSQAPCDHGHMARRTGSNARGDINELSCAISMIEHGFAVNALTATDTGWDLHCHIPDDLILSASAAGRNSWQLSGKTAHIQVKSAATDSLSIGTVRGWLTGTASGVPTLMFGHYRGRQVFSAPNDLEAWLASADRKVNSDDVKHKYTYAGRATEKQTPLSFHQYVEERFPSVIQLWTEYPQIALDFPDLTTWMNHEDRAPDPRPRLVENLALAVWADARYDRNTEDSILLASLSSLYGAAGCEDGEACATEILTSGLVFNHTYRDEPFSRDRAQTSIVRATTSQTPEETAREILERIHFLHATDASPAH